MKVTIIDKNGKNWTLEVPSNTSVIQVLIIANKKKIPLLLRRYITLNLIEVIDLVHEESKEEAKKGEILEDGSWIDTRYTYRNDKVGGLPTKTTKKKKE